MSFSLSLLPPTHVQAGKYVYFLLYMDGRFQGVPTNSFIFPINPEDFNYSRPERVQVVQTLGSPFVDEFGTGVPAINIRGTTGWRTRAFTGMDGYEAYRTLHRDIIDRYFSLRQARLAANLDPDGVRLILLNCIDNLAFDVVPSDCRLLRNKQQPLLYQYDLNFIAAEDLSNDPVAKVLMDPIGSSLNWIGALVKRLAVFSNAINFFAGLARTALTGFTALCTATATFLNVTCSAVNVLTHGVGAVASLLYNVCASIDASFRALKETAYFALCGLETMVAVNHIFSVFSELKCYFSKGVKVYEFPDYSKLYGVTDCASSFSSIQTGSLALSTDSGLEWASNLKDAIRTDSGTDVIAYVVPGDDELCSAPVQVSSDLPSNINEMYESTQSVTSAAEMSTAFSKMADVLNSITFDEDLVTDESSYSDSITSLSSVKMVRANENDSLQSIAYRELGDPARWPEIVSANDLVVENIATVWLPILTFTYSGDLAPGTNFIDLGYSASSSASVGSMLEVKDTNGLRQKLMVSSISGSKITFADTFSRYLTGPITITRYDNRGKLGLYDYKVQIASSNKAGTLELELTEVKDVYPGYVLCIQQGSISQTLTVKSVDYLERLVQVNEKNLAFDEGADVLIFDTESQLNHIEVGTELKIPTENAASSDNRVKSEEEIFGTDIALDSDGLLIPTSSGDLDTVSGLENLKQAIRHRLHDPYGSLIMHPDAWGSGLEAIRGQKGTSSYLLLARSVMIDALGHEPRISLISQLKTELAGDALRISAKVAPVDDDTSSDLNLII